MKRRFVLVITACLLGMVGWWLAAPRWRSSLGRQAVFGRVALSHVSAAFPAGQVDGALSSADVVSAGAYEGHAQHPPVSTAATLIGSAWDDERAPVCVAFREWTQRLTHTSADLAEGVRLASARRAFLSRIIATEPQRVLAAAVPWSVRSRLPGEVVAVLEERIDGSGEFYRMAATPRPGEKTVTATWYESLIAGRSFITFPTGPTRARSLERAALHGVAFDRQLAVTDSPVRTLEVGEPLPANRPMVNVCLVSGQETIARSDAPLGNVIDAGDRFIRVCNAAHIGRVERSLRAQELAVGAPWAGDSSGERNLAAGGSNDGFLLGTQPEASWTTGSKKLLLIRVDFSDLPGTPVNATAGDTPITETALANVINGGAGVRDFFAQNSFNRTAIGLASVDGTGDSADVTAVLRLPRTASYYAKAYANTLMHADAREAAASAGFDLTAYDRIGVVFSFLGGLTDSLIDYAGLGNVEGRNFWINGWANMSIIAHELGHTYGLPHAGRDVVYGSDPLGLGDFDEYGDVLDVMGNAQDIRGHFNQWAKAWLHWIDAPALKSITTSGTYRVGTFDHAAANPSGATLPLALRISRQSGVEYWIGHRGQYPTNSYTTNGAYIVWARSDGGATRLIDCNYPSDANAANAPLAVGQTLSDPAQGIVIKTLAHGGSGASEWVDVQVTFDAWLELGNAKPVADETVGPYRHLLLRTRSSSTAISGAWATVGAAALPGFDFTASSGALSWSAGSVSPLLLPVPVINDAEADDGETFSINVTGVTGATLAPGSNPGVVTIRRPGAADLGFRNATTATMPVINNEVLAIATDDAGRVLIGGWFDNFGVHGLDYLARLKSDGTEDTAFVATAFGGMSSNSGPVRAIAVQADGKIIVGGGFFKSGGPTRLTRLNPDGSLDAGFNIGSGPDDDVMALAVQPDGKILVAGIFQNFAGGVHRCVVRLNTDGTLDGSFASPVFGGTVTPLVYTLVLAPDGKVMVGGQFIASATSPFLGGVMRLNADGSRDGDFQPGNGIAFSASFASGVVNAVALLPNGNIAVGGSFNSFSGAVRDRLVILTSDGGLTTLPFNGLNNSVQSLLPLPDGSLVVGGAFTASSGATPVDTRYLARLLTNGEWDAGWASECEVDYIVDSLVLNAEDHRVIGGGFNSFFDAMGTTPLFRVLSGQTPPMPVLTQQPHDVTIDEGQPLSLGIALDAPRAWCQWLLDDHPVLGATSRSYGVEASSKNDSGVWRVRVTTPNGEVLSEPATVIVRYHPVIAGGPLSARVDVGEQATLSVSAKGGDLLYQWQKDEWDIPSATSDTLVISPASLEDAAGYRCIVTNNHGSATSDTATLTVVAPPIVHTHPEDAAILAGQSTTLKVAADGLFLAYQWKQNGKVVPGATSATYTVANATTLKSGLYTCVVSNSAGDAVSNPGHLYVVVKPTISAQPVAQVGPNGGSAVFTVAAAGEFLTYQWQRGTVNLSGETSPTLTVAPLSPALATTYRCVVSNFAGTTASKSAALTVYGAPVIHANPVSQSVPRGQATTLSAAALGSFVTYQWQRDEQDIPGATGTTYRIPYPDASDVGAYRLMARNAAGTAFSTPAALTVLQPPLITTHPTGATLDAGQAVTFTVAASGDQLTYQWQKNGAPIVGAINASYMINSISTNDVGGYRCVVKNSAGSAASTYAALQVNGAPNITVQPLNVAAEAGCTVTLSTFAPGTAITYQWQRNATNLVGKTQSSLVLAPFASSLAGSYTCVVGSAIKSATTRVAQVSVVTNLRTAMDDSTRAWQSMSPGAPWAYQTTTRHDGGDAVRSGAVLDGESCTLKTTVTGPVLVRFWRKISSEAGHDFLRYTVDGSADADVPDASGEVEWQECLSLIPAGTHELAWTYQKDAAGFYGSDAAWLDQFSTSIPAYITAQPTPVLALAGGTAHFEVSVRTLGATYQWRKNGSSIAGATARTLDLSSLTTTSAGDYSVLIGGKLLSASAKLLVVGTPTPSRIANDGTATLSLPLGGSGFTSYQWMNPSSQALINDARISGSATSKLTIKHVTSGDTGNYMCRVTAFTPQQSIDVTPCIVGIVTTPIVDAADPVSAIVSGSFAWQLSATQYPTKYVVSGLPSGLSYNAASGLVSGIPNTYGSFNISIVAKNAPFSSAARVYVLTIDRFPVGASGNFSALVSRQALNNDSMGGLLTLSVGTTGTYTGKLTLGSKAYNLGGRAVAVPGNAVSITTSYTPSGGNAQGLVVTFDATHESISGNIAGSTTFSGAKHVWSSARPADAYAGIFNCTQSVTLSQQGITTIPQGSSATKLTVSRLGPATVAGKLPDGTSFTFSGTLWPTGSAPMFVMLYNSHGSVVGTQTVLAAHVTGGLTWWKNGPASSTDTNFPTGFSTIVTLDSVGAP